MNRKKKIFTKLSQKAKKANLKANPKHKPKYISKADRADQSQESLAADPLTLDTAKANENNDKTTLS